MNAFVVIKHDLEMLRREVLSQSGIESAVCVGLYEFGQAELATLRQADNVYIVVSKTSMCSTAYQSLLLATIPLIQAEKCRLLKLDDTQIPAGFFMLNTIPEGMPA